MTLRVGLLNLKKPVGVTSRDVVNRVQRLVRPAKAGHAGTLDPLASGVIVVCMGPATRLISYVQRMPKRYTATFLLGRESPSEDVESEVTLLADPPVPTLEEIRREAAGFTGEITQRPPAYSALKVGGRRAYKLARAGQNPDLQPRRVIIHALAVTRYQYPDVELEIECGSGTYVRSLGRDLAHSLGSAAVMSALVRTAIGTFRLEKAVDPDALTAENLAEYLLPARSAVESLPAIVLSDEQIRRTAQGISVELEPPAGAVELAALDARGQLVAILARRGEGIWGPTCNLPRPESSEA